MSKELKPWPFNGYAPGNYMNKCTVCGLDKYNMDKLCFVCLECAVLGAKEYIEQVRPLAAPLEARIRELEEGLRLMTEGFNEQFELNQKMMLEDTDAGDGWISVEEGLPELGEYVLVVVGEETVLKGRLYSNGWFAFFTDGEIKVGPDRLVTHWRKLPPAPKTK